MRFRTLLTAAAVVVAMLVSTLVSAAPLRAVDAARQIDVSEATGGKGGPSLAATQFDLASVGYEQHEYFLTGDATAYTSDTPLTSDGKWTVHAASSAPYKTRVVVYRPIDAKRFNGTVLVEWGNVSGGVDAAPAWISGHTEMIREGFAYVEVAAQQVGVQGGGAAIVKNLDLQHADPDRYGSLVHPGDSYSYDMFTQAGDAVRRQAPIVLGGLRPQHVLAVGESQSAFALTTYIDAFAKTTKTYDGYLVYSRISTALPLSRPPLPTVDAPNPTRIRTDLHAPVLTLSSESDVAIFHSYAARQPDTPWLRTWEVAGTAHDDTYGLGIAGKDTGQPQSNVDLFQSLIAPPAQLYNGLISCGTPINSGGFTYVVRAAIHALNTWVVDDTPPPKAKPLATVDGASPLQFRLDAAGNVQGGVRTPEVDVPVAKLSGQGQTGGNFCAIFGTTVPFDAAKLAELYPSHARFVKEWDQAVDESVRAGFVLQADAPGLKGAAAQSTIGEQAGGTP